MEERATAASDLTLDEAFPDAGGADARLVRQRSVVAEAVRIHQLIKVEAYYQQSCNE